MADARDDRKAPFIALAVLTFAAVAVGAFVALGGAGGTPEPIVPKMQEDAPTEAPTEEGNAATNVVLGWGRVASVGDWSYFVSPEGSAIYRVATGDGDGGSAELVYEAPDEGAPSYVTSLNLCGERLYFALSVYYDASTESSVHSTTLAGEDERVVFSPSAEEGVHSIEQLYVYEGTLYVVTLRNQDTSQLYEIWKVAGDGSAGSRVAEVESSGTCSFMVTPDRVFYADGATPDEGGQAAGRVFSLDLEGGDPELVYESGLGAVDSVVLHDGRLYLNEGDYATGERVISSVAPDGSDHAVVCEVSDGLLVSSYVLSDDAIYVALLDPSSADARSEALVVPLDDGSPQEFALPGEPRHLTLYDAGERLFVMGSSSGGAEGATLLATVGLDGSGFAEIELPGLS